MSKYKFETLEEYREHQRANARKWYQANKEKKKEYQLKRYYSLKAENQQQNLI